MKYDTEKMRCKRQNMIDNRKESVKQRDTLRKQARRRKYSIDSLTSDSLRK